jgi:hypothetical protein
MVYWGKWASMRDDYLEGRLKEKRREGCVCRKIVWEGWVEREMESQRGGRDWERMKVRGR